MKFKDWVEMQLNKDVEDGMHYWTTPDDLAHVSFRVDGDTMHVDYLRNQEEFDSSAKGTQAHLLTVLRELKSYLRQNPQITRITANVQNKDVKRWLLSMGARIIRGGSIPVMELPVEALK